MSRVVCPGFWPPNHIVSTDYHSTAVSFLLRWMTQHESLRAHRSLKASCATLWWRLLFFVLFLVMEYRWNETDRRKPKYSRRNLPQCHFFHHKFHMDSRNRTRAAAVGGRRLTAWAMARLLKSHYCMTTVTLPISCSRLTFLTNVSSTSVIGRVLTKSSAVGW
jgi:hypothetical protein